MHAPPLPVSFGNKSHSLRLFAVRVTHLKIVQRACTEQQLEIGKGSYMPVDQYLDRPGRGLGYRLQIASETRLHQLFQDGRLIYMCTMSRGLCCANSKPNCLPIPLVSFYFASQYVCTCPDYWLQTRKIKQSIMIKKICTTYFARNQSIPIYKWIMMSNPLTLHCRIEGGPGHLNFKRRLLIIALSWHLYVELIESSSLQLN